MIIFCNVAAPDCEDFESIVKSGISWRVNDSIEARLVVGAGDTSVRLPRFLGAKSGGREIVVAAQEIEFELT